MINIIVAYDENLGIGKDNKLCWRQSTDILRFKKMTTNKTVVMGRKTYDSIGRLLPNRRNIILSRNNNLDIEGAEIFNNIDDIIKLDTDIFIIGGGDIYSIFMDIADNLYITEISVNINADAFFPKINLSNWELINTQYHIRDDKNQYDYKFIEYKKK